MTAIWNRAESRYAGRVSACMLLVAVLAIGNRALAQSTRPALPTNDELDAARSFLQRSVLDRADPACLAHMAILQRAADLLSPKDYVAYENAWDSDPALADRMEAAGVLYYLKHTTDDAIADIRRTRVIRGLVAWQIYNVGYVFKTPDACFGIDLHFRNAQRLAKDLDFLLVTHRHGDHTSAPLMDAMIRAGKPVVTSWYFGSRLVQIAPAGTTRRAAATMPSAEFRFGRVRVKVDIGDHHRAKPDQRDNMLMYQVDCGQGPGRVTVYHSGDGSNPAKMRPDRPVDAFIVHVAVGMPLDAAAAAVKPRVTLVSHVLELAHSPGPPNAWRWSLQYSLDQAVKIRDGKAIVPTWGQRWLAEGTETE